MRQFAVMIKPASSLCNLRCRYCFYADISNLREVRSYGIMKEETVIRMLDNIFCDLQDGDVLDIAFQGGEPTFAGLDFFLFFVSEVEKRRGNIRISYAIQTNGILLDENWCQFFKKYGFLVGLSLDIDSENHNSVRVDSMGKGTYQQVEQARRLLEKYQVEYNILAVLTNSLARHPKQVWNFIQKKHIRYLQLIPCLSDLECSKKSKFSLTPQRFASFYTELFHMWYEALKKGDYYSIKLFDDLINLLAMGWKTACGITGQCSPQIVVEADGGVYPCDFYVLDEHCVGTLTDRTLLQLYHDVKMKEFREIPSEKSDLCTACQYNTICGGGCKRMRKEVCYSMTDTECGYRSFLDHCLPDLLKIAEQVREMQ